MIKSMYRMTKQIHKPGETDHNHAEIITMRQQPQKAREMFFLPEWKTSQKQTFHRRSQQSGGENAGGLTMQDHYNARP